MRAFRHLWICAPIRLIALCTLSITNCLGQDLQLPADYDIDLQLGVAGRSRQMGASPEITGTPANTVAGGQIYVHSGMLPIIGENRGLWAAVLSHEVAHTGRRHQVKTYVQMVYNERMIEYYRARVAAGDKSANWSLNRFPDRCTHCPQENDARPGA